MFDKRKFLWVTFVVLIFFNFSRFVGWKYLSETAFWKTIVYDNLHHYQLGLILLILAIFVKRLRTLVLALGAGMVIDESMYLFYPLNNSFSHGTLVGFVFEFFVLAILGLTLFWNGRSALKGDKISS